MGLRPGDVRRAAWRAGYDAGLFVGFARVRADVRVDDATLLARRLP